MVFCFGFGKLHIHTVDIKIGNAMSDILFIFLMKEK